MKNNWKDYFNIYLFGSVVFAVGGVISLVTGYGYAPGPGLFTLRCPMFGFLVSMAAAVIFFLFDIVYVQLKRRHTKKCMYKEEGK